MLLSAPGCEKVAVGVGEDMRKQTKLWTMRNKSRIRICDMEDSHLLNTIRYLERQAENKRQVDIDGNYRFLDTLNGEMAQMCVEQTINHLGSDEFDAVEEYLSGTIYEDMLDDAERRGLECLE